MGHPRSVSFLILLSLDFHIPASFDAVLRPRPLWAPLPSKCAYVGFLHDPRCICRSLALTHSRPWYSFLFHSCVLRRAAYSTWRMPRVHSRSHPLSRHRRPFLKKIHAIASALSASACSITSSLSTLSTVHDHVSALGISPSRQS